MKKLVNVYIILLFIFFANESLLAQRNIYVSPTGTGTGDGTITEPIKFSDFEAIYKAHNTAGAVLNIFFAGGVYEMENPLVMSNTGTSNRRLTITFDKIPNTTEDVIFNGVNNNNSFITLPNGATSANSSKLTIKNVTIKDFNNSGNTNALFTHSNTYVTFELENVIIDNCGNSAGNNAVMISNLPNYSALIIKNSTIRNCTYYRLHYANGNSSSIFELSGSSVINNSTNDFIFGFNSVSEAIIYNNTFSHNTTGTNGISITTSNVKFFNNTVYNSGNVHSTNSTAGGYIINNILAGTSRLTGGTTANINNAKRNTSGSTDGNTITFYTSGNTNGIDITTNFYHQFDTNLTGNTAGQTVHQVTICDETNVIFSKGGLLSDLYQELGISSDINQLDQIGRPRPEIISLGALDAPQFTLLNNINLICRYNSENPPGIPLPVVYDCSDAIISYPSNVTLNNTTLELDDSNLENGSVEFISYPNSAEIKFTPLTYQYKISGFKIILTATDEFGILHIAHLSIKTSVYNELFSPGYVDPDLLDCFTHMGEVVFGSSYRFISREINGSGSNKLLEGFSIPLVGDLDGDGYPEIIAQMIDGTNSSLGGSTSGVEIFNGQTGKSISRIPFPEGGSYGSSGYHGSPSMFALVDSDRDGIIELIVAFPNSGTTSVRTRVASYNLLPIKDSEGTTISYSMTRNWLSSQYNITTGTSTNNNYEKAIPQVVDLDGDGIPEIIVYNKIYNAQTGDLLLTLETLHTDAHVGVDRNAPGGEGGADAWVNFSYIYDMDGDGIYDIVAGGKVYKITKDENTGDFLYDVISMEGVNDGRTGVADIDGDGIPDVVAVYRASSSNTGDLVVKVWNPGFHITPGGDPYEIASKNVKLTNDGTSSGTGSNSYVYIGDIDGREQTVNGVNYRLPEIAILTRTVNLSEFTKHPNIKDLSVAEGGIPSSYSSNSVDGVIFALTYDVEAGDLKGSFILEHKDRSINTGFTMFDFDNDGIHEICYRDMETLRIIKPVEPYVPLTHTVETRPDIILFKEVVKSYTGFELPIIADIDNDASAEIVVIGYDDSNTDNRTYGYIFAVGSGENSDKFAPALPVWNQFMYSPFKIRPDLTTPIGPAINPLDPKFTFSQETKSRYSNQDTIINNYRPFNNTLGQIPYYMTKDDPRAEKPIFEPIVFLTKAYLADDAYMAGNNIIVKVGNTMGAETDISPNTPLRIYKLSITPGNLDPHPIYAGKYTIGELQELNGMLQSPIKAGEEIELTIPVSSATGIYHVRVCDDSRYNSENQWEWSYGKNEESDQGPQGQSGIGVARRQYRDCGWEDNYIIAANFALVEDLATVQEYNSVTIDILDNDKFPDDFFNGGAFSLCDSIIMQPKAGVVTCTGTGPNSQLIYTHTGLTELTEGIDSLEYRMSYYDTFSNPAEWIVLTAKVYIYVLQSKDGSFAGCYAEDHTVELKVIPEDGVSFYWYAADGLTLLDDPNPRSYTTITAITGDSTYYISPTITDGNYKGFTFPKGKLTIPVVGYVGSNAMMKWTGLIDKNWHNPGNWIEIITENGKEKEVNVNYTPTGCVNVIIPSGLNNYPELSSLGRCGNITMEDRAMIAKIHNLTYENAEVELTLQPTEKERFVMWSAPLKGMYSGDYHFNTNSNNEPVWDGDVYMNLFQSENPDGNKGNSSNYKNAFTATFGNIHEKLELGRAFNLIVTNKDLNATFKFPKELNNYEGVNLDRIGKGKFIADATDIVGSTIPLPVYDKEGYEILQVPNPFMAYLDVIEFMDNNNDALTGDFKIWNGNLEDGFVTVKRIGDEDYIEGQRYYITNPVWDNQPADFIPPLQSFLVVKRNPNSKITSLKISPEWTTTDNGKQGLYELRSSATDLEQHILRIKAGIEGYDNYTILHYDEMAVPGYKDKEDAHKLFNPESAVEIYTFANTREALDFNSSGDYSQNVRIGIKMKEAGKLVLDFTGMERFRHNVFLIDHEDDERTYDLNMNSTLEFEIPGYSTGKGIDLPNRFSLLFKYTGIDTGNEVIPDDDMIVIPRNGTLTISAGGKLIENLQVYNVWGQRIYQSRKTDTNFKVPVKPNQFYIVKGQIDYQIKVVKTIAQ